MIEKMLEKDLKKLSIMTYRRQWLGPTLDGRLHFGWIKTGLWRGKGPAMAISLNWIDAIQLSWKRLVPFEELVNFRKLKASCPPGFQCSNSIAGLRGCWTNWHGRHFVENTVSLTNASRRPDGIYGLMDLWWVRWHHIDMWGGMQKKQNHRTRGSRIAIELTHEAYSWKWYGLIVPGRHVGYYLIGQGVKLN